NICITLSTLSPYTTLFRSSYWDSICKQEATDNCAAHSLKTSGVALDRYASDCTNWVCSGYLNATYPSGDSYCCNNYWDGQCVSRSEEHTSELQSRFDLVCR